jgi:DNA-binding HxlR family transcriptional regulator
MERQPQLKNNIKSLKDYNIDHIYKHLEQNGLVPRKQGFGVPPSVRGNSNVLGDEARKQGLPHIVSGINLSEVFGQNK